MDALRKTVRDVNQRVEGSGRLPKSTERIGKCKGACKREITRVTFDDGEIKNVGCRCKEVEKIQARAKDQKRRGFYKASDFPYSPRQASFEKYKTDDDKNMERTKAVARNFADKFPENYEQRSKLNFVDKKGMTIEEFNEEYNENLTEASEDILTSLILMGTPGSGKTMLANAIYHTVHQQGYNCFFIESTKYLDMLKESFKDDEKRIRLMKFCEHADLLIVDDIGTDFNSNWATEQFKKLADLRQGKFTVYTSNLTEKEFLSTTALHRIYSRMNQNGYRVEMNYTDKRLKGVD